MNFIQLKSSGALSYFPFQNGKGSGQEVIHEVLYGKLSIYERQYKLIDHLEGFQNSWHLQCSKNSLNHKHGLLGLILIFLLNDAQLIAGNSIIFKLFNKIDIKKVLKCQWECQNGTRKSHVKGWNVEYDLDGLFIINKSDIFFVFWN